METDAAKNFSAGFPAIKQEVDKNPSFSLLSETEQQKDLFAGTPDVKVKPEIDDYEIEIVPLEVAKNVYVHGCIKQEPKPIEALSNKVVKQEHNLDDIYVSHNKENRKLINSENTNVLIEKDASLIIDNLNELAESASKRFKEYNSMKKEALIKMEPDEVITDFKELHEVDFEEWKIKNEELDIKEDLEGEASISADRVHLDNQVKCETPIKVEFTVESSLARENLSISAHYSDEMVQETSLKGLHFLDKYPEESKTDMPNVIRRDYETVNRPNIDIFPNNDPRTVISEFKCAQCKFQTNYKIKFTKHVLQHQRKFKLFKCNECAFETRLKRNFKLHLVRHIISPEKPFKCNKCNFQTKYKQSLKRHMLRHPNKRKRRRNRKRNLKARLLQHNNSDNQVKCETPIKVEFTDESSLARENLSISAHYSDEMVQETSLKGLHFLDKYPEESKTNMPNVIRRDYETVNRQNIDIFQNNDPKTVISEFKCDQCQFQTNYKIKLTEHVLQHQRKLKPFKCNECEFATRRKRILKLHLARHIINREKPFKCNKCNFQTKYKQSLKRHMLRHPSKRQRRIKHKRNLKTRLLQHNNSNNQIKCETPMKVEFTDESSFATENLSKRAHYSDEVKCETPMKVEFADESSLASENLSISAHYSDEVKCETPMKVEFTDESSLANENLSKRAHYSDEMVHETSLNGLHFRDKYPEESRADLPNFIKHEYETVNRQNIDIFQNNDPKAVISEFKCDQCKFQTNYKIKLTEHVLQHQRKLKPFKCNECEFETTRKRKLKLHLVRHITNREKPFKCNKCNFQTKYKQSLKRHMLRHPNLDEVAMSKSNKRERRRKNKINLRTRLLQLNNPEEVDTFKCDKCDFQTESKKSVRDHMQQHRKLNKLNHKLSTFFGLVVEVD